MNKPLLVKDKDGKLAIPSADVLGFDPAELRKKYLAERDRRIRKDGAHQYVDIDGDFEHYKEDPHITETIVRDPVTETV